MPLLPQVPSTQTLLTCSAQVWAQEAPSSWVSCPSLVFPGHLASWSSSQTRQGWDRDIVPAIGKAFKYLNEKAWTFFHGPVSHIPKTQLYLCPPENSGKSVAGTSKGRGNKAKSIASGPEWKYKCIFEKSRNKMGFITFISTVWFNILYKWCFFFFLLKYYFKCINQSL